MDVIIYPRWDLNQSMLTKGAQDKMTKEMARDITPSVNNDQTTR